MAQVASSTASVPTQSTRNLEEMAEFLREILLERHASADAALLTDVLESIQRKLVRSSLTASENRPAA